MARESRSPPSVTLLGPLTQEPGVGRCPTAPRPPEGASSPRVAAVVKPGGLGGRLSAARARLGRWGRRAASMSLADWSVFLAAAIVNPVMYALLRFRGARASSAVVDRWSARQLEARRQSFRGWTLAAGKRIDGI